MIVRHEMTIDGSWHKEVILYLPTGRRAIREMLIPIGVRSCYDEGKRFAETLFFDKLLSEM